MKYWAKVMGQVKVNNGYTATTTIQCLDCFETRGLKLVTDSGDVTGAVIVHCPNGHRWQDARIRQDFVISVARS